MKYVMTVVAALLLGLLAVLPVSAEEDSGADYRPLPRYAFVDGAEDWQNVRDEQAGSTMAVAAEEYSWTEDTSKQGLDGFYVCTATATFGGNTGSITHNVGPDWDQPRDSEMRWQKAQCERISREDVVNLFHYRWGQNIDPSIVKLTGHFA